MELLLQRELEKKLVELLLQRELEKKLVEQKISLASPFCDVIGILL